MAVLSGLKLRTAWMAFGQSAYIASQFFMLVALTRFSTLENVGRFGLASAVVTPVYWLTDLGLRTNKNTDAGDTLTFANIFMLRLLTSLCGYVIIVLIALLSTADPMTRDIMLVFGAAKGIETLSDIAYGVLERHGRMALFALSIVLRGVGSLVIFTLLLYLFGSISLALLSQLIVWAIVFIFVDSRCARQLTASESRTISWKALWETAVDSRHLGAGRFVTALTNASPRFVIGHFIGMAELGLFTAISYVLQAALMLMTAVTRSITGHLADLALRRHESAFNRIVVQYTLATAFVGLAGTVAAWWIGEPVITLLFGPEFDGKRTLIVLILLTATVRSVGLMMLSGPLARRMFKSVLWVRTADLVCVTTGCAVGVWLWGLDGAAAGLALAALVQLVLIFVVYHGRSSVR